MTYLLLDRPLREAENLTLWLDILQPVKPWPVSPAMRRAVVAYEQDRRLGERRQVA